MGDENYESGAGAPAGDGKADGKFLGQKERRRSSALKMMLGDYMNLSSTPAVLKLMQKHGDTKVLFSDTIIKVNKRNKMQDRVFLLTESGLYNLENLKLKRRIALKDIGIISMSMLPDNFFSIHVPSEYDYLLVSGKKVEIVTKIMEAFKALTGRELPINFNDTFDYRIDNETVREIHFSRVEGGVSTQIYTKARPKPKAGGS